MNFFFCELSELLRHKWIAMTCRKHRHCENDSLKQSRKFLSIGVLFTKISCTFADSF
jgi:hypothetical protein